VNQSIRLRYLFSERMGGAWGNEPEPGNNSVCIRAADFETHAMRHKHEDLTRRTYTEAEFERKQLKIGDLIIEKSGGGDNQPVGRTVIFDLPEPATCSNFLEIIRPNQERLSTRFGSYLLYSLWASRHVGQHIKKTTGIQNLDSESYFDQRVWLPSLEVQQRIADFLDAETAQIDALILEKERMLELLEEKRAALISHAVTKGLNPNAPMKDSGLEWVQYVPASWTILKLKRTWVSSDYGISEDIKGSGSVKILRMTCIVDGAINLANAGEVEEVDPYLLLKEGDFLFNRTNSLDQVGKSGILDKTPDVPTSYASYMVRIRFNERATAQYMVWLLNCKDFLKYARSNAIAAIGQANLSPSSYGDISIPIPPIEDQFSIIEFLEFENSEHKNLSTALTDSIKLLSERRSALITAAVTGQLEVQGVMA
jgi:type I restriction enzyme, S subunit